MMTTAREKLIDWLRDAHGAEEEAHNLLKQLGGQISSNMEFGVGLEVQGERAGKRAAVLQACLAQLGTDRSLFKAMTGLLHAQAQAAEAMVTGDEPARALNSAAGIAGALDMSYRLLLVAAKAADEAAIGETCNALLADVDEFAAWLHDHAQQVAERYISIKTSRPTEAASLPTG